jgi:hypothetical protein
MIKKTGKYKGKSDKLGGGGRFAKMVAGIMRNPGMTIDMAEAIANTMSRKKQQKEISNISL